MLLQTQQDYIEEWLPKKPIYLDALLSMEAPESFECLSCHDVLGDWRCRDCLYNPIFCTECCRNTHAANPFHRIDHWTGTYFEPAWLFQVGLVFHLGHEGNHCPSYFNGSPPVVDIQDATGYEDDTDDITKSDTSNNIVRILKRFTGVYDLGSTTYPTPLDCHQLMVVDVSGVHRIWVKWCNCPDAHDRLDIDLLRIGLFPASYKNIKTAFTFRLLDDVRMSNLECKSSVYQYYQKLRRLTAPMFPSAVEVLLPYDP